MTDALREAAQAVLDRWDSPKWEWISHGPTADLMTALRAALSAPPAVPPGMALVPDYRGYAHLGTGQYVINNSDAGDPAELIISIASEAEKAGRVVGEDRDNPPGYQIQPEQMAVRLRFTDAGALGALEQQLRYLRAEHFPASQPPAAQPATDKESLTVAAPPESAQPVPVTGSQPWQPIETAPKVGKRMFVVIGINVQPTPTSMAGYTSDPWCVWRDDDGGFARWPHAFPPTHWHELPDTLAAAHTEAKD